MDAGEIMRARVAVAEFVSTTPLEPARWLSTMAGRQVFLKCEHRQRTGSFKIRGALAKISTLPPDTRGVVTASAGNHAQGVALAARRRGIRAVVFMPRSASAAKVRATQSYGAEVRLEGDSVEEAMAAARSLAAADGLAYVHPFDDRCVIAGQGTLGVELVEQLRSLGLDSLGTVVVPVGGGGLIAGVAAALKAVDPGARVVGVQALGAASVVESLRQGRPVRVEVRTVADGIAVSAPSELTLAHVAELVDEVVVVDDAEITRAMVLLLERQKALVEPAGAVGVAAVLAGEIDADRITVVLSGGNVDLLLLSHLIEHGLSAAGRYLRLRALLPDRPGALARLAAIFGELGVNIVEVEHHRAGAPVGVDEVEVTVTAESRGPEESAEVLAALQRAGIRVERW